MKKLLTAITLIWAVQSAVYACACCAERGTYSIWTSTVSEYANEILKEIRFGKTAEFYMTEADLDETHGLGALIKEWNTTVYEDPTIVDAYLGNTWRLEMTSRGGLKGTLVLPRPMKMTTRRVHIPDNRTKSVEPVLYKELIFNGSVREGRGFFRAGIMHPTKYTLIFQGWGNNCDDAGDFKNWHLDVDGRRSNYTFFGKTAAGEKDATDLTPKP